MYVHIVAHAMYRLQTWDRFLKNSVPELAMPGLV
jgi:hypothetical protein